MTSFGNLLAPPTRLPVDPAAALLAEGADPIAVAAANPASCAAWAALAEAALAAQRPVEAYAYARTGYHRGLDALRRAGWKGQGPIPWSHEPNRGFLRALHALGQAAAAIGEDDEADRCRPLPGRQRPRRGRRADDRGMTDLTRRVGARLVVDILQPARVVLQVAAADTTGVTETLLVGPGLDPQELVVAGLNRLHVVDAPAGRFTVTYSATVLGRSEPQRVDPMDEITYLRPSRYAESDRLGAIAMAEFAWIEGRADLLAAVSSWVGSRIEYVLGSSGPTDGAVDTMLERRGVCRDFAHLVIALLRSLGVPARLAAVYAPGLDPMDFHAVAEAAVDGYWRAVDATLLAPRSTLLRIATGRDAADTSFLSIYGGAADLLESEVWSVVDGDLPGDDVHALVSLT